MHQQVVSFMSSCEQASQHVHSDVVLLMGRQHQACGPTTNYTGSRDTQNTRIASLHTRLGRYQS